MNKKLHAFNTCFCQHPPDDLKDHLVIYSKKSYDADSHHEDIYNGYIEAADIIIGKLYSESELSNDDQLALPLLNLYINAIELRLKLLNNDLESHKELNCCTAIKNPSSEKSILDMGHKLPLILDRLSQLLPKNGELHEFHEFQEIREFIEEIYYYNINAESTRYVSSKNGKILNLHQKPSWINFKLLHNNIHIIDDALYSYIYSDGFFLCANNQISTQRLNELQDACKVMLSNKAIFENYKMTNHDVNVSGTTCRVELPI